MHLHFSDPSAITALCDALLTGIDNRIIIQQSRSELLTSSIRREMNRPDYAGDSSFLSRMIKQLLRTYDFRALKDLDHPITEKAIYNEAVILWNTLKEEENFKG